MSMTKKINNWCKDFKVTLDAINNLCKSYVDIIEEYPEAIEVFKKKMPMLTSRDFKKIEGVGRGSIVPELAFSGSAGTHLSRCPMSIQKKFVDSPIPVLTMDNTELLIKYNNLTSKQVKQVFSFDGIRDLPAQKAFIESERIYNAKPTRIESANLGYEVKNNKIYIGNVIISKQELEAMLKAVS